MRRKMKKISVVILLLSVILIMILLKNMVLSNRLMFEKMVSIVPSTILILYRFDFFNQFLLLMGFLCINLLILIIGLFWLIHSIVQNKKRTFRVKNGTIAFLLITCFIVMIFPFRWLRSRILFAEGYQKYQMMQNREALDSYEKSIRLAPTFSQPYLALMNFYQENDHYQEAIHIGEEYLKRKSDFEILKMLGSIAMITGDYQLSIFYLNRAFELKKSPDIHYQLAKVYYLLSDYKQCNKICILYPSQSKFSILYAKSLFEQSRFLESLSIVSNALILDDSNPEAWFIQGRNYLSLNMMQKALTSFEKTVWLKKEFPEAYIQMAQICIENRQISRGVEYLEKAVYFDNSKVDAYIQSQLLKQNNIRLLENLNHNKDIIIKIDSSAIIIEKDKSIDINIDLKTPYNVENMKIEFIEPYGWGVLGQLIELIKINNNQCTVRMRVTGKRDCRINLENNWKLNIVAYYKQTGDFNNIILSVEVHDTEPGKVLFLITEDFECIEGPHQQDATPDQNDLSVRETNIDLIGKGSLSDSLANIYDIKWSHIADLGSAFLRLKWLAEVSNDSGWYNNWSEIKSFYTHSISSANDIQLHIHSYNIPGSPNYSQQYNKNSNQLITDSNRHYLTTPFPDGHFGAWANIYHDLGYYNAPMTRVGSIFNGLTTYEQFLHEIDPNYRILFFRAGEWEFGSSEQEMRKSIIALRSNKILAGSDAYKGRFGDRDFIFNKRIGDNVYFSSFDNIREPTRSLLDIGILQILPIPELHHFSHVRPVDPAASVIKTYGFCLNEYGDIKSGVYLLVEMYHINRINFGDKHWDTIDLDYGDWKRLKNHFQEIEEKLKKAQFVTISQAIVEYLDYYTPDIIALRINEQKIDHKTYSYDIKLIGKDIIIDDDHTHFVSIKPPSYLLGSIESITLFHNERTIKIWKDVHSYDDLEFVANSSSGYKIQVKMFSDQESN